MRVTNSMMVTGLMNNLENNLNRMSRKQDELASGKRVLRASDNPIEASKILKYKTDLSELDQFGRNTNDALSWLEVTESSIADTGSVLQRMRELTVQAANGTNATEDTQKIAKEIESLRKQLISNGNFNFAGRYVFSGTQTDQPFFNDDGTFNINVTNADLVSPQNTFYNIGIGEQIVVNTPGIDVYGFQLLSTAMTQDYPDGIAEGTVASKAVLSTGIDTGINLTGGVGDAAVTIRINGTPYTLDNTVQLPLTNKKLTDLNGSSGNAIDPKDILDLVRLAKNGATTLSSFADVYFDGTGKLTIKSKTYGAAPTSTVQINFTPDSGAGPDLLTLRTAFGGIADGAMDAGSDVINAVLTGPQVLTNADIATPAILAQIENQQFTLSLNGVQKTISIGTLASQDQTGLSAALNTAFDGAFGPNKVVASFVANRLTVSTANQPNTDEVPSLEMRITRATESSLIGDVNDLIVALNTGDKTVMNTFLGQVDDHLNRVLSVRADIGARVNRMDLVMNRITDNSVSFTKMLSNSQDADMAEVIMNLKNAENVYKSALSVGARVIQPSLIDFVR